MRRLLRNPGPVVGVLVFALVSIVLTSMVGRTLSQSTDGETLRVRAEFTDAAGLRVGDDVRIAGVRVGRVSETRLVGEVALVTLDVERSQVLDAGTRASIDYLNLMGQRYVALSPGADDARPLRDGETIPLARTSPALDLTALFNAFKPLFDNLDAADINQLAGNLVQTLQGQGPTLRDLLRQTAVLTGNVAERDEVIGQVIDNVSVVLETTAGHRRQLVTLIDDLGDLTHGLARDRDALGASMDSIQELTSLVAGLLDETATAITRDVAGLRTFSAHLADSTTALRKGLAGIPTQLALYIKTLSYGSFLNVYVCNLDLKATGTPSLDFPPGDRHSERCR
ncbi:MAG: MlaD family protein [Nocardioides sp.]|nr:MlaD family protein [Nocardioides sp.]